MLNLYEAALAVALMGVLLGGFLALRSDFDISGDAGRVASVVVDLHESVEAYLEHEYPVIEQCLGGEAWGRQWRTEQVAGTNPTNNGVWVQVPLYPDGPAGAPTTAGYPGYLGDAGTTASLGVTPTAGCLPSLASTGFLPASLKTLRHNEGAAAYDHLYDDRFDLRVIARLVQMDPDPAALEPVVGVQMLTVMKSPENEPIHHDFARRVLEATGLPEAGIVGSTATQDAVAEQTVDGVAGSWRLEVCGTAATPTDLAVNTCAGATDASGTALDTGETTVITLGGGSDPALLAFAAASGERLSGQAPTPGAGAPHAARLVTITERARSPLLRDVLHRNPVAGAPELMRLGGDLDLAGYGMPNTAYLAGVDTDADGYINQGPVIIGPHPAGEWLDTNADGVPDQRESGWMPTTVVGDLHVRGALVVDPNVFPTNFSGAITADEEAKNLQPGSIFIGSPMNSASPGESGSVFLHGNRVQIAAYGVDTALSATTDAAYQHVVHTGAATPAQTTPRSATQLGSGVWPTGPMRKALEITTHSDGGGMRILSRDGTTPGHTPVPAAQAGRSPITIVSDGADSPIEIRANGAMLNVMPAAGIRLVTTGEEARIRLRTEGENGHVRLLSQGESSHITARTEDEGGRIALATEGVRAAIAFQTQDEESPITTHTGGARSHVLAQTTQATSQLRTEGAGGVHVTSGPDANITIQTGATTGTSPTEVRLQRGGMGTGGPIAAGGIVVFDPEEVEFRGRTAGTTNTAPDNMRLSVALGAAFIATPVLAHDGTSTAGAAGTSADTGYTCPLGTRERKAYVPTGWTRSRHQELISADGPVSVRVTIPDHGDVTLTGTAEVDDIPIQFSGWSFDPTTGVDDGIPQTPSGPGNTTYSIIYVCSFV